MAIARLLTRKERQLQTRAAIIAAAEELFAKHGVEGTSLQAIAEHAGLTQGAIYSNFKSKSDLWTAIGDKRTRVLDVEGIFTPDRTLQDSLRECGVRAVLVARELNRTDILLDQEFQLFAQRHATTRRRLQGEMREADDSFGGLLERNARARRERLPMPGRNLASLIRIVGRGLILESAIDPSKIDEKRFVAAFVQLGKR